MSKTSRDRNQRGRDCPLTDVGSSDLTKLAGSLDCGLASMLAKVVV
jgi:hypothetical protein